MSIGRESTRIDGNKNEVVCAPKVSEPGYWIEPNNLSDEECEAVIAGLSCAVRQRSRAGIRHLMSNPVTRELAMDVRLVAIARRVLGAQAIPFRATLFEKSGQANWLVAWHQDTALPLASRFEAAGWGPWSEKAGVLYARAPEWALSRVVALRVHLDASDSENGSLRVVPGSHEAGVLTDREVFAYVRENAQVECVAPKGGVLAMRPLLIHSSSKASAPAPRRVLHIEYADSLNLKPGIRLAVA